MEINPRRESCCELGEILYEDRLLYQTDNFMVAPSIGPMGIEGYLLILTKEHYIGMGNIPNSLYPELVDIIDSVKRITKKETGKEPLIFEHGPKVCGFRGGGCLDHAHLHVVPGANIIRDLAADMVGRLSPVGSGYGVERIDTFKRLSEIYSGGETSYLYVDTPNLPQAESVQLVAKIDFDMPSQYVRQIISRKSNNPRWSWRQHPDIETLERTVERLKGKF